MNSRLLICGMLLSCALQSATLRNIPLGFEHNGAVYSAQADRARIDIDAQGFSLYSAAGSVTISARDANPHAAITGLGNAGTLNRFIGNNPAAWSTGVRLYDRVDVSGVYPGIDLTYYGRDSHLEYDFTIAPQADPNRIALQVTGANSLTLDHSGNLQIKLSAGILVQHAPTAYQMIAGRRHPVESRFAIQAGEQNWLRFVIGDYDRALPLIIDPVVAYSSFLGGTGTDEGHAIAVDSSGNYFVAGRTFSTPNANSHVLVFEVLAAGGTVQSVFGGTAGNDTANAIAVDSTGNVYLAGSTSSSDYPIGGENVFQSELAGTQNAFVTALEPGIATLIFSTFIGGDYTDEALGIAVGPNDNLYVVGDTESTNFSLISSSAFQITNHGGVDAFLFSLTTVGVANFGTYLGGSGNDYAYGVAVDSTGNIYVVGATTSVDYPVTPSSPAPFQTSLHGTENAFAIEFVPGGEDAYWSTYIGGENADAANAVALDAAGHIFIAGTTGSTEFPVSPGAFQTVYQGGGSDGFVIELNNDGQTGVWSTYLGGELADTLNALVLDSSNNIVVTGSSDSLLFPVTADAVQSANAGGQDVILATISNAGSSLLFSTYFGGSGNDVGTGVAVDATGHTYLTGITASSNNDFPITSGAFQPTYGGGSSDAFFSVFGCSSTVPTIGTGGVVNAASSLASAIAPGGIISIYGTNMGCTPTASSAVPLPTSLGGVTVQVNDTLIPLFYVSETQLNAQLPYETPTGTASVTVTGPGGTSTAASITVVTAAPGIFAINGQAAALNSDGTLNTPSNPAKVGSYISVYFTGQGPVSQPVVTGAVAAAQPPYINVTSTNSATIGGATSTVYFMGLASGLVGLAQANLEVPNLGTGTYPVVITIDGLASAPAMVSLTQ